MNDAVTWRFFQEINKKKKEKKSKNNFPIYIYIYNNTVLYNSRPFSTSPHDPETTEEGRISIALEYPATKTDTWILDQTEIR